MSSPDLSKSALVRAPFDYAAVANNFGVLKFSGGVLATETTHKANVVPNAWRGQYVEIYVTGGVMHYAFSTSSAAEVDRAVAATEAGASVKVGGVIPNGETRHVLVPDSSDPVYFVRESDTVGTIAYMRLASG